MNCAGSLGSFPRSLAPRGRGGGTHACPREGGDPLPLRTRSRGPRLRGDDASGELIIRKPYHGYAHAREPGSTSYPDASIDPAPIQPHTRTTSSLDVLLKPCQHVRGE